MGLVGLAFEDDRCSPPHYVYKGVLVDGYTIYTTTTPQDQEMSLSYRLSLVVLALVDLPLSATVDTLILPITIPFEVKAWIDCAESIDE